MSDKLTKAQAKLLMSWLNATLPDVAAQLAPEDLLAWAHEGCQGAIHN
jgi:hypothetical protein